MTNTIDYRISDSAARKRYEAIRRDPSLVITNERYELPLICVADIPQRRGKKR